MASILITGGAGFIGSHTAVALARQGHAVRILDVLDPQVHGPDADFPASLPPDVERIRGDVRDAAAVREALAGVDAVFHLAALTGVGQSMYELASYVDVNGTGTATLLEQIARRGRPFPRIVLASSRAVYGEGTYRCADCGLVFPPSRDARDLERGDFELHCPECGAPLCPVPTAEARPLDPVSLYGWTKRQQEELCRHAARTFGFAAVCLRYFNVYGSGQSLRNPYTGIVSIFYSRIMANRPISLYERGLPGRDFVHVSDVVRANCLALDAPVPAGSCVALNVGTGRRHSVADIALALGRACGRSPEVLDHGEFRAGDVFCCFADVTRAARVLGYVPRVRLQDGLREWARWAATQEAVDGYDRTAAELERHGLLGRSSRVSPTPEPCEQA